jgi:hypothetical protein
MTKHLRIKAILLLTCLTLAVASCSTQTTLSEKRKVGVVFLVHGGFEGFSQSSLWDSTLQIFSYDPHSFVYQNVIWSERAWPMILNVGNAPKEQGKYAWENERLGGPDPAMRYSRQHLVDMTAELDKFSDDLGIEFVTDYMSWIGDIPHLAQPRNIYNPGTEGGSAVTYCGSKSDGGVAPDFTWPGCDPERYNVDGPIERMLAADVEEIVVVDLTTSGVRFFKSNDAVRLARQVIADHNENNGTKVTLHWINDPTDLMRDSYPDAPAGWTNSLGAPEHDRIVPLDNRPNPIAAEPGFAQLHAEGIEAHLNSSVGIEATGIMLVNHATRRHNQTFDPKIDDTLILNRNIETALLERNPGLSADNIVGSWMGVKEFNPALDVRPGGLQMERTREMRGENLGHAYLYESDLELPAGKWGYRYWDALEQLKNQGVKHIVIAFPQITVDSVLNQVELPNQIGKEIGFRTWLYIDEPDFETYPEIGHPFADYWGIWIEGECPAGDTVEACCFEMGGCADGRPYPPARLAAPNKARDDLDPSLAYDVSAFGHLGYDPAAGKPSNEHAVQNQYRGTWATWTPPNTDPRVGKLLAQHVLDYVQSQ